MSKNLTWIFFSFLIISIKIKAQESFPINGINNNKHITYALINAHIFIDYKTELNNATLIIKDEKVVAVGEKLTIPEGSKIIDLNGRYIYPSFIDVYTNYGISDLKKVDTKDWPQLQNNMKGAYGWNESLKCDFEAFKQFANDEKEAEIYRKNGFGAVVSMRKDGVARGTAVLVNLTNEPENNAILKSKAAASYSFNKGTSTQDYPSSLMGAIALLRQTYYDVTWYKNSPQPVFNITLETWNSTQNLPQFFEVNDKLSALRADKIGDEFGIKYIIKASGNEYQRITEMKQTGNQFILPLNFPAAADLSSTYDALNMSLTDLKNWEMAPSNPYFFEKYAIDFAFTCDGLKDKSTFFKQLQKSIIAGLTEQQALKALLETPAKLVQASDMIGALKKGMYANFIITTKPVFDKENIILENWVAGKQFKLNNMNTEDVRGNYSFSMNKNNYTLKLTGQQDDIKVLTLKDTLKLVTKGSFEKNELKATIEIKNGKESESFDIIAFFNNRIFKGYIYFKDGTKQALNAIYNSNYVAEVKKDSTEKKDTIIGEIIFPFVAYGNKQLPIAEDILIQNATVWTNEKDGILESTDVLLSNGKITKIGKGIIAPTAKVINGKGKHVTAGIIDEHSHIAATGNVNEGTQSVSSEVRIADIIDSDDINIYRQLSGGVTTSQILHGSANAIGGQAQLIKLRWGKNPEQLKFENADGFIKFALGENVKQSNWGDKQIIRYPQTRMGVEQTFIDAFTRATEYQNGWNLAKTNGNKVMPRKDLELEALVEIMNKKRFITCHSYEQSEINMLMHVADSFKFTINTFTHILEGYKVADKMKKHGAGCSTFSDWWAYKYEVMEAIPYNGAILHEMKITTAYNSDDVEMARRLNQEAAKAIKYGNVSEEEALKFVTLNPAKLLHIDNRVGSIAVGKDADLVVWNNRPLSIYAKPDYTFVDGICYYDNQKEEISRTEINAERARIIYKMKNEKDKKGETKKPTIKQKELQHCEDRDKH